MSNNPNGLERLELVRQALQRVDHAAISAAGSDLESRPDIRDRANDLALELVGFADLRGSLTSARGSARSANKSAPYDAALLLRLVGEAELLAAREVAVQSKRNVRGDFEDDVTKAALLLLAPADALNGLDRNLLVRVSRWSEEDLTADQHDLMIDIALIHDPTEAEHRLLDTERIGLVYFGYLGALWWRHLVVSLAVLRRLDESADPRAVSILESEALVKTKGPAEAFASAVGAMVDSPREQLSEEDEQVVRAHLNALKGYYSAPADLPRVLIQKPVEEIVRVLAGRLMLGDEARAALRSLGADPAEVVDEIMGALNGAIESITLWDAQDNEDSDVETAQLLTSQDAVAQAVAAVSSAQFDVQPSDAEKPSRMDKARDAFATEFGKSLGGASAKALVGGLSVIAVYTAGSWSSAAARLLQWLMEYLHWAVK